MQKYLSREQLAALRGLSSETAKDLARKGLLCDEDIEIGADFAPEELGGATLDAEATGRVRPRKGYLPVTAVSWERPGRGNDRIVVERVVREPWAGRATYTRDQLAAAEQVIEAAYSVLEHLRRQPLDKARPEWQAWRNLTDRTAKAHAEALEGFVAVFAGAEAVPAPEQVLGLPSLQSGHVVNP